MKKILLISFLLLNITLFAQNNCDNDVRTDFNNPNNNALPIGVDANKYLNGFNWFPVTPSGLYEDYPCTDITFGGVNYPEMNNILLNSLTDYDYLKSGPLPLNQNGWELLLVNLGRFPDDVTPITSGNFNYSLPYIVIYNRYSGIIRIFMNFGLDHTVGNGADAIEILISFQNNNLSGLLRLNEGEDKTLDNLTNVKKVGSICKAPAQGQQWASTDIRIAYDPCSCYYPSKLKIDFKQITSSTIKLHGRSITLNDQPLVNNTTLQVNPSEYLSGFDATGNSPSGGIAMQKSMVQMIDDYLKLYEKYNHDLVLANEHNVKVKRNLAIIRAAKFIAGTIQTAIDGGFPIPTPELISEEAAELAAAETLGLTAEQISEAYDGLGATTWWEAITEVPSLLSTISSNGDKIIDTKSIFDAVSKIFGEKGEIFIANNFVEQHPSAPTMPTASFTEMHYVGEINTQLSIGGPLFYTPGTYGSVATGSPTITSVYEYPVYNEILGTFALLETPKIQIWESGPMNVYEKVDVNIDYDTPADMEQARYKSWDRNYEIKLKDDLKYVFNTALDIKSTNIQASFNLKSKLNNPSIQLKSKLSLYNNSGFKANTNSNTIELNGYSPIVSYGHDYGVTSTNLDFDESHFIDSIGFNPSNDKSDSTFEIQSTYVPIDAFFQTIGRFGLKNEFESYNKRIVSDYEYFNTDIFNGDHTWPYDVNFNYPNLFQNLPNYTPSNGYEYDFEVELKLVVNIEFNTLNQFGSNNVQTQVLTYKIDPSNIEMYPQPMSYTTYLPNLTDLSLLQYDMVLNGANFNGQSVAGCQLVGNTYTCQAMNNLKITDDILVSPGYNVNLFGGNEVTVENESIISPQSVLAINPVLDYSHPMPNATSAYVQTFCQGANGNASAYKANAPSKRILDLEANSITQEENLVQNFNWDFCIYPNPTTSNTTVVLSGYNSTNYSVEVSDMTGKVIYSKMNKGEVSSSELELSGISKGVYFVKVNTLQGTKMKQLVIQ